VKILVVGSGFLGTPIIENLQYQGHEVLVLSRNLNEKLDCNQLVGDAFNEENLIAALNWRPQIVIQTAWITSHRSYTFHPMNELYANFTIQLAQLLLRTNVRHFIVLGSCAEYGAQTVPSTAGITNLNPETPYARQKVRAFRTVSDILRGSEIRLTWVRVFQPYGPGQDSSRLIPYLVNSLTIGEGIRLLDNNSFLDWISTWDIASAISWILENETPTEVDVGTGVAKNNIEVLQTLEGLVCKSSHVEISASDQARAIQVASVGKNSPLFKLGWKPKYSLIAGLERLLHK
jgi:nucleoside-diphosphate-sugar epimerase